jgi:hypothetical protein
MNMTNGVDGTFRLRSSPQSNLMPAFDIFSESELLALSRYLASLR